MASTEAGYFNTMASALALPCDQHLLYKSNFPGQKTLVPIPHKLPFTTHKQASKVSLKTYAKFNISEILGGRGLCNGEIGIEKELQRNVQEQESSTVSEEQASSTTYEEQTKSGDADRSSSVSIADNPFGKELMGLTGGFPGGEKGLQKFIEENPPERQKGSESPVLLPGTPAIVKNPNSPYYMYCGTVQQISNGMAGVLFEGGNWNRLKNFRLDELEQREKGTMMENPKSATVEDFSDKGSK